MFTNLSRCWKKILALAFGMGAVSGIATAFVVGAVGTLHLLTDRATALLPI